MNFFPFFFLKKQLIIVMFKFQPFMSYVQSFGNYMKFNQSKEKKIN